LSKEDEKIEPEGKPPLGKRGMVSEDDLMIKEAAEAVKKGESVEIPPDKVLLLFIAEGIYDVNQNLTTLIEIFKKAEKASSKEKTKTPIEEVKTASPLEISQAEDRVKIIVKAFAAYTEDVILDDTTDAMFVMVKPRGFLGKEKFAKLGAVTRELGGTYQSQGRESHFKIPKMMEKAEPRQEQEQSQTPVAATPPTELEGIKMTFPENLESLLTFTEKDGKVIIKPRQFLGTENFTKIASIVREINGSYVSAGKESHFEVPLGGK